MQVKQINNKIWFKDELLHREDGPAIEHEDGSKEWWTNGQRHRQDGPAIEYSDGTKEWWVNGEKIKTENDIESSTVAGSMALAAKLVDDSKH